MAAMDPILEQNYYRIRDDANSADGGTPNWISTENQTTRTVIVAGVQFRVRFVIANSGSANVTNGSWSVFYSLEGAAYTQIGNTTDTDSAVRAADNFAAGTPPYDIQTTNFVLTAGDESAATTGRYDESDNMIYSLQQDRYTELEFGLRIYAPQVNVGDTIDLRVYEAGAALDTYDTNATALIEVGAPPPDEAQPFTRYNRKNILLRM